MPLTFATETPRIRTLPEWWWDADMRQRASQCAGSVPPQWDGWQDWDWEADGYVLCSWCHFHHLRP